MEIVPGIKSECSWRTKTFTKDYHSCKKWRFYSITIKQEHNYWPKLEKNLLIVFIYGLNTSFKVQFYKYLGEKAPRFFSAGPHALKNSWLHPCKNVWNILWKLFCNKKKKSNVIVWRNAICNFEMCVIIKITFNDLIKLKHSKKHQN